MRRGAKKPGVWRVLAACLTALVCAPMAGAAQGRPRVGVAFGGGSARGLAHVGVIRWLEEHHIPIDVAAGTSIGGLIGGSFAIGMNAAGPVMVGSSAGAGGRWRTYVSIGPIF